MIQHFEFENKSSVEIETDLKNGINHFRILCQVPRSINDAFWIKVGIKYSHFTLKLEIKWKIFALKHHKFTFCQRKFQIITRRGFISSAFRVRPSASSVISIEYNSELLNHVSKNWEVLVARN